MGGWGSRWSSSAPCWGRRRRLEARVQLVFSGTGRGSSPERRRQKGGLPGAGLRTKRGAGGAEPAPRAGAPRTADPHDCERRFLRLIPTSMKTARAGPPAGPLSRPPLGTAAAGVPPPLCVSSPRPTPPSPPQLPGRPRASQGFRLGHLDAQSGAAPLIWGRGGLTPGSAGRGGAVGGRAKRGCGVCSPLGAQGCASENTGVGRDLWAGGWCCTLLRRPEPPPPPAVSIQMALRARNSPAAPQGCPEAASLHTPPGIYSTL